MENFRASRRETVKNMAKIERPQEFFKISLPTP